MKYITILLILLNIILISPVYSDSNTQIDPLTNSDNSRLEQQRKLIAQIVRENFGYVRLQGSVGDLDYLQKIVDRKLIPKQDKFVLQSLGVILGDVMTKNLDLQWAVVEDRYGRSRALRFADTDNFFFPLTVISRRVESDMPVNIKALYNEFAEEVAALQRDRSRYRPLPKPRVESL